RVALVVLIERRGGVSDLARELRGLGFGVVTVPAAPEARPPGKRACARDRTALWDAYLAAGACEQELDLASLPVIGTPPPVETPSAWPGRQIALLNGQTCVAFGEVVSLHDRVARIRARGEPNAGTAIDRKRTRLNPSHVKISYG